jgi:ABC-type transporter Mla subunit MlaD
VSRDRMLAELEEVEQHLQSVADQVVGASPDEETVRRSLQTLIDGTAAARQALGSILLTAQPASWARSTISVGRTAEGEPLPRR